MTSRRLNRLARLEARYPPPAEGRQGALRAYLSSLSREEIAALYEEKVTRRVQEMMRDPRCDREEVKRRYEALFNRR